MGLPTLQQRDITATDLKMQPKSSCKCNSHLPLPPIPGLAPPTLASVRSSQQMGQQPQVHACQGATHLAAHHDDTKDF